MLQLLLTITVLLGSFEPFCTAKRAIDIVQPQSECPPECPPGFVARFIDTSNGGFYSCDQFSLGGSEGKDKYFFQLELMSQFYTLQIDWW